MNREEKKEMIERLLGPILDEHDWYWGGDKQDHIAVSDLINALAAQAIVIECELEHDFDRKHRYGQRYPMSLIKSQQGPFIMEAIEGHHGTPGKAIAIIVSLAKEEE